MEDLHLATAMCIGLRRSSSPHTSSVGTSMFGSRSVVSVSAEDFAITRKPSGWKSETTADISSLRSRSEEHTSELQSRQYLACRLLLEKKKHDSATLIH